MTTTAVSETVSSQEGGGSAQPPSPSTEVSVRVGPRSILGKVIFAATLLGWGVMLILDNLGYIAPLFHHYAAAAVVTIGAGLLVGTFWGRTRGAIVWGLVLLPILFASAFFRVAPSASVGEFIHRPVSVAEVDEQYGIGIGSLIVDLRDVEFAGAERRIEVSVGIGEAVVYVPASASVVASGRVGVGDVNLVGRDADGVGASRTVVLPGHDGSIIVDINTGIGSVQLREGR